MNSKWAEKIPHLLHYVATIYLLNEWVKVSNCKLFLPKNVVYLIKVNIYMHTDKFFSNHQRKMDFKLTCLHFSFFLRIIYAIKTQEVWLY